MSTLFSMNLSKINATRPQSADFLSPLINIPEPPDKLYYRGRLPEKRPPTVAIVGSRKPTKYGKNIGYKIAYDLAKKGVIVVSGLALGIDAIAHTATLDASGTTVAVLASPVSQVTPRTNHQLGQRILDSGGVIISETNSQQPIQPHYFLKRNRLVSGLADAVIVIEAAARSGTLSTAAHALDQGRSVFAVPGNIDSPLSAGCNKLIQQGAMPLLSIDDVLHDIAPASTTTQATLPLGSTPLETAIIRLLADGMSDGEELLAACQATPAAFSQALTMLELDGTIRPLGADQWALR